MAASERHRGAPIDVGSSLLRQYQNLAINFEPNVGQAAADVAFIARGRGYNLYLTSHEAVLALHKISPMRPTAGVSPRPRTATQTAVVRMTYIGANKNSEVSGMKKQEGRVNYFIGTDSTRWRSDIPTYAQVRYDELYPGIDVIYYGNHGLLENDFIVSPGASVKSIRFRFDRGTTPEIDTAGRLIVHVPGGFRVVSDIVDIVSAFRIVSTQSDQAQSRKWRPSARRFTELPYTVMFSLIA